MQFVKCLMAIVVYLLYVPILAYGETNNRNGEIVFSKAGYALQPIKNWRLEIYPGDEIDMFTRPKPSDTIVSAIGTELVEVKQLEKELSLRVQSFKVEQSSLPRVMDVLVTGLGTGIPENAGSIKRPIIIGGNLGYCVMFNGKDTAGQFALVLLPDGRQVLMVLGSATPPEAWHYDKEFENVLSSIRFFPLMTNDVRSRTRTLQDRD